MIDTVEWLLNISDARLFLVCMVVLATAMGVLGLSFTLGGIWTLRGRVALQRPTCVRCSSLLRAEGNRIAERCPECGLESARRGSVRWLRFRRQPATLLVTLPVVFLGGMTFALFVSVHFAKHAGFQLANLLAELAPSANPSATSAPTRAFPFQPIEADPPWSATDVPQVIEVARGGGADGALALIELLDRASLGVNLDDGELHLVTTLLRDSAAGRTPAQPYRRSARSTEWLMTPSEFHLSILQHLIADGAVTESDATELARSLCAPGRAVAPRLIRRGDPIPIRLAPSSRWGLLHRSFTAVRVNGRPVNIADVSMRKDMLLVPTAALDPDAAADAVHVVVEWTESTSLGDPRYPAANVTVLYDERSELTVWLVDPVNGVESIGPMNAASAARTPHFERSQIRIWAPANDASSGPAKLDAIELMLEASNGVFPFGEWTLHWEGGSAPLGSSLPENGAVLRFARVVERPADGWPPEFTLSFRPFSDDTRRPAQLYRPKHGAPPATTSLVRDRAIEALWTDAFDLHCSARSSGGEGPEGAIQLYQVYAPTW